jgi:hypothetical protein
MTDTVLLPRKLSPVALYTRPRFDFFCYPTRQAFVRLQSAQQHQLFIRNTSSKKISRVPDFVNLTPRCDIAIFAFSILLHTHFPNMNALDWLVAMHE